MWSWQRKADGNAMAVDVKVGVGRFFASYAEEPSSTES